MYCIKQITEDLIWVGGNDRRLAMFEGVYSVPQGVSYNSYLLPDEKTVLFDTVDKAVEERFFENLTEGLNGRALDYLVIENGSWASASGKLIREKLETCKNITFFDDVLSIKSSLKAAQSAEIDAMANALGESFS